MSVLVCLNNIEHLENINIFVEGLGSLGVGDLLSMSDDGGGGRGEPSLIKTEIPPLIPTSPPGGHVPPRSADTDKQVQAAMAMAAFYSQSPLWQAAVAAREVQAAREAEAVRQLQNSHSAAVAALSSRLPPRGAAPLGFAGLPGLGAPLGASLGAPPPHSRASLDASSRSGDLYRDYLSKLAQSTLASTTTPSTLSLLASTAAASHNGSRGAGGVIEDEKPLLPATIRRNSSPGGGGSKDSLTGGSSKRHSSPSSLNPYFQGGGGGSGGSPYFGGMKGKNSTSPDSGGSGGGGGKTRSPPGSGRGRSSSLAANRDKVFTCPICHRSFGYKHVLQNHERTHTGEKPFECKECHKRFTRDHHLKTHMRLHTGEKPYSCTHCDRQFVQVANLRRHIRVHTGERPYKCELCPSNFSDSNQLKAHMLMHKGQSLNNLKEELLFRHSLAAGSGFFPNPYSMAGLPPHLPGLDPAIAGSLTAGAGGSSDLDRMSPASKETGGSSDSAASPLDPTGENFSDSNSEKKRSRKQKPRKISTHHQPWTMGSEGGAGEEGSSPPHSSEYEMEHRSSSSRGGSEVVIPGLPAAGGRRARHSSDFSEPHHPVQNEPEDLTVKSSSKLDVLRELQKRQELLAGAAARRHNSSSMEVDVVKDEEAADFTEFRNTSASSKTAARSDGGRSEEGGSSNSPHSTPRQSTAALDDDIAVADEDERGVSPPTPLSHPPIYNPLFANTAAIQLGLAGAAMPLGRHHLTPRFNGDKVVDSERIQPLVAQKEISQQ